MRISDCSSDVCSSDLGVGANFASAVMEKAPEWADLSKGARSKKTVNIPLYVDLLGRILRTAMHDMGFGFETRNFGRAVVADLDLGIGRHCFSPLRVSLTTVVFYKKIGRASCRERVC